MRSLPALLALLPAIAAAIPADETLALAADTEKFLRLPFTPKGVIVDPPGLATAEALPSNEVFLTTRGAGPGVVLAWGNERIFVWQICVGAAAACPKPTVLLDAKPACPTLTEKTEDGAPILFATIPDEKCLVALGASLSRAPVRLDTLRFILEETAAWAFYKRVAAAVKADPVTAAVTTSYGGVTLRIKGAATPESLGRTLLHAWRETLGRVSFEVVDGSAK